MNEGAQRILERALTDAVARPLTELKRKNRFISVATMVLGTALILTGIAFVQARSEALGNGMARHILEAGYLANTVPVVHNPFILPWRLEDGTTMLVNLPRLIATDVSL